MGLKERIYSVLVVSAADSFNSALSSLLPEQRFSPVKLAVSVSAAKRLIAEREYDFVIINSPLQGEETSTNPMATIFAWSGALRQRGLKDGLQGLVQFADALEAACFDTLGDGIATKDLVNLMEGVTPKAVNSAQFISAIRERLEKRL